MEVFVRHSSPTGILLRPNPISFIRHTVTLRFPEVIIYCRGYLTCNIFVLQHPTIDERETLDNYFHLTSRLYPCGECAEEFQELLKRFPPQVSGTMFDRTLES